MAWLRLDDGFPQHPKLVELTPAERWTWVEVLAYCARYKTQGKVARSVREAVPRASAKMLDRFAAVGLLDKSEGGWEVHDWAEFNPADPTAADRMRRHRNRNQSRNGDRNEVRNSGVTEPSPRARASGRGPSRPYVSNPPNPLATPPVTCPECGIAVRPPTTLADHLYVSHDIESA